MSPRELKALLRITYQDQEKYMEMKRSFMNGNFRVFIFPGR